MPSLQNEPMPRDTFPKASTQPLRWILLIQAIAFLLIAILFSPECLATEIRLDNSPKPLEVEVDALKDDVMITADGKAVRVNADTIYSVLSKGVELKAAKGDIKEGMKVRIVTRKGHEFAQKITILEKANTP